MVHVGVKWPLSVKLNCMWYFVTKIVLTYCEKKMVLVFEKKKLKFETKGQEFAKFLRSLEQFIQTVKGQNRILF